jgi:hypothetical protein
MPLNGLKVLVVEDSADNRDLFAFALESSGANVLAVGSAQEGLKAVSDFEPDVLVCDITMPDMDGYTLLQMIRDGGSAIPAMAVTGNARERDRQLAMEAGFQAHEPKPVDIERLVRLVALLAGR